MITRWFTKLWPEVMERNPRTTNRSSLLLQRILWPKLTTATAKREARVYHIRAATSSEGRRRGQPRRTKGTVPNLFLQTEIPPFDTNPTLSLPMDALCRLPWQSFHQPSSQNLSLFMYIQLTQSFFLQGGTRIHDQESHTRERTHFYRLV